MKQSSQPSQNHSPARRERASDLFIQQLLKAGIDTVYGNPGTFEQQFLEALPRYPELRYVLCLHEVVAVGAGIGHAHVTKRPAFVQLHASVGLGNGAGMILEAKQSRTPMVVYVGENTQHDEAYQGFLAADIVTMGTPLCKAVERVTVPEQLCRQLRRAIQVAMTPPMGPVLITIPMDVLEAEIMPDLQLLTMPSSAVAIAPEVARDMASALLKANSPALIVGDGVGWAKAQDEVQELSRLLGIPVYGMGWTLCNAYVEDPLFQEVLSHADGSYNSNLLAHADLVFAVGAPLVWEIFPGVNRNIPAGATLMHLEDYSGDLGRNFPATLAAQGPIRPTLRQLIDTLKTMKAPNDAKSRAERWAKTKQDAHQAREAQWGKEAKNTPNHPAPMLKALANALPDHTLVYEEAMTSQVYLRHYLTQKKPDYYFRGLSRCLGADWPSAIAAKLANPEKPVAAISSDGTVMFVPQALWTAAHLKLDMVFVVLNNRSYRVLKHNIDGFRKRAGVKSNDYPHMDLTNPLIDFTHLASSMGVAALKAETPAELSAAIAKAFAMKGPVLVEAVLDNSAYYS